MTVLKVDLTLREDPRDPRTIDSLLASGWFSNWQRRVYELAANSRVCVRDDPRPAVRLGAQAPRMASASQYEVRYGKTECELRGLAVGLITAGFTPRCIAVGDAPDSLVTFDDGDVWVEFAEIVDAPSARYTNMMNDLSRDVRDDVDADAQASRAVKGYHLEFRLAVCPTKAEVRAVREDLLAFLRSGSHAAVSGSHADVPVSTPMLRADGNDRYFCADWAHYENGSPHILRHPSRPRIRSFSHRLALAPVVYRRLERKRRTAVRYGAQPIWLVLGVTDLRGVWDASVDLMSKSCPPIDPFSRVILCDGPRAIIWSAGVVAVRDVRSPRCRAGFA